MRISKKTNHKPLSQFLASLLSISLFVYFGYHLLHGDRGYFALKGVESKLTAAEKKYETTKAERIALENRVKLLRPDSIDLDMLDERARVVLGFARPQERVILEK